MIEELPESFTYVLGFKFIGEITDEDYTEVFLPAIYRAIDQYGTIRILVDITDFQSEDFGAMHDDVRIGALSTFSDEDSKIVYIEREAIVGGEEWELKLNTVNYFFLFPDTDVRFFRDTHRQAAWNWVCEGMGRQAGFRSPIAHL